MLLAYPSSLGGAAFIAGTLVTSQTLSIGSLNYPALTPLPAPNTARSQ